MAHKIGSYSVKRCASTSVVLALLVGGCAGVESTYDVLLGDRGEAVSPPPAAPTVKAPAIQAPAIQAPAIQAPAIQAPAIQAPGEIATPAEPALAPFTDKISGTTIEVEMIPVPAGRDDKGRRIEPFWIAKTETTWDLYDVFVYKLDRAADGGASGADASTRPSKPYIAMDRGFGHNGMPALSMSFHGAREFCKWLSLKTGRKYRIPTEAEWRHACRAGGVATASIGDHAWFDGNADHRTHPVGSKRANALGIHDLHGNASEWCVGEDGKPVTLGGCYNDPSTAIGLNGRVLPIPDWNASDPQFPKSKWWLADAGFVGLRVVCDRPKQTGE